MNECELSKWVDSAEKLLQVCISNIVCSPSSRVTRACKSSQLVECHTSVEARDNTVEQMLRLRLKLPILCAQCNWSVWCCRVNVATTMQQGTLTFFLCKIKRGLTMWLLVSSLWFNSDSVWPQWLVLFCINFVKLIHLSENLWNCGTVDTMPISLLNVSWERQRCTSRSDWEEFLHHLNNHFTPMVFVFRGLLDCIAVNDERKNSWG